MEACQRVYSPESPRTNLSARSNFACKDSASSRKRFFSFTEVSYDTCNAASFAVTTASASWASFRAACFIASDSEASFKRWRFGATSLATLA